MKAAVISKLIENITTNVNDGDHANDKRNQSLVDQVSDDYGKNIQVAPEEQDYSQLSGNFPPQSSEQMISQDITDFPLISPQCKRASSAVIDTVESSASLLLNRKQGSGVIVHDVVATFSSSDLVQSAETLVHPSTSEVSPISTSTSTSTGPSRQGEGEPNVSLRFFPFTGHASLFVGNLSKSATETTIMEIFSKYGTVVDVQIARHRSSLESCGHCFVAFSEPSAASEAMSAVNGSY
jgi:hypothetical protein